MSRTIKLNSKINIKQPTSGDLPLNPLSFITRRDRQTSTAGQTVINLTFAIDLNNKDAFILAVNGRLLDEGALNDYQFTSIQANNTSSQVTLTQGLTAGLPIVTMLAGALVQLEPNVNSLQAAINNLSGSGQGGINYIASSDAEKTIAGWSTYLNTAGVAPVIAAGGVSNLAFTQSAVSPLRGTNSFLLAKDAANRQGQGVAYDFTVDTADLARVLTIDFDYSVDTNYVDGDISLWIYDKVNGALIQPAPYTLQKNAGGRFKASFQTASNSSSYRLVLHVSSSNALAYNLKLDRVTVGPTTIVQGTPMTDFANVGTLIVGATTTAPTKGPIVKDAVIARREGDSLRMNVEYVHASGAGTAGSGTYLFTLPSGMSMDLTKIAASTTVTADGGDNSTQIGFGTLVQTGGYEAAVAAFAYDATRYYLKFGLVTDTTGSFALSGNSGDPYSSSTVGNFGINNLAINLNILVPIAGWSSNVQMSQDTDTRVVAARVSGFGSATLGTSAVVQMFNTIDDDTHAGYNASTGVYTIQVPGRYRIWATMECSGALSANNNIAINIVKNGATTLASGYSEVNGGGALNFLDVRVQDERLLVAGDTIQITAMGSNAATTRTTATTRNFLIIERLSGPAQIAASESINCRYTNASGFSVPNAGNTVVNSGWVKDYDTHGAGSTSGLFTAPIAGKYRVAMTVYMNGFTSGVILQLYVQKNSGSPIMLSAQMPNGTDTSPSGSTTLSLQAGDTLAMVLYQNSGVAKALLPSAQHNHISIERVGN
jgi:hypothetical protein